MCILRSVLVIRYITSFEIWLWKGMHGRVLNIGKRSCKGM